MSELQKIKNPKLKGYLTNFDFSGEGSHLAITDPSQGGAASLKNVAYLTKAVKEADLNDEQKQMLADFGEEFMPLSKCVESTPSPEDSNGEDVNKNKDGKQVDMTIEKSERELELEKQVRELNKSAISGAIKSYGLSEEVSKELSEVLVDLDIAQKDAVTKAFDELKEKNKEAQEEVESVKKSVKIEKEVTTEVGADDDLSKDLEDKPLTFKQKVEKARTEINKEAK